MFSVEDRTPVALKSMVVYQFSCAGCNSRYIGETSRHVSTRIKEHTESDKNSHIFKHFNTSPLCKSKYSPSCFSILDSASNSINLKHAKTCVLKNWFVSYSIYISSVFLTLKSAAPQRDNRENRRRDATDTKY